MKNAWITATLVVGLVFMFSPTASAAEPAGAGKGSIKGKIVNPDGKPAAGVPVRLMGRAADKQAVGTDDVQTPRRRRLKGAPKAAGKGEAVAETTADASGEFAFADVAPGRYVVVTRMKGIGAGRQQVTVTPDNAATVTLNIKAQAE